MSAPQWCYRSWSYCLILTLNEFHSQFSAEKPYFNCNNNKYEQSKANRSSMIYFLMQFTNYCADVRRAKDSMIIMYSKSAVVAVSFSHLERIWVCVVITSKKWNYYKHRFDMKVKFSMPIDMPCNQISAWIIRYQSKWISAVNSIISICISMIEPHWNC